MAFDEFTLTMHIFGQLTILCTGIFSFKVKSLDAYQNLLCSAIFYLVNIVVAAAVVITVIIVIAVIAIVMFLLHKNEKFRSLPAFVKIKL